MLYIGPILDAAISLLHAFSKSVREGGTGVLGVKRGSRFVASDGITIEHYPIMDTAWSLRLRQQINIAHLT